MTLHPSDSEKLRVQTLLGSLLSDFRNVLGDTLTGFYVHGSIAFGCFTWKTGDVDFLAVVSTPPSQQQKTALIRALLDRTPDAPPKGIEMSVVSEDACRHFVHPSPFLLHFSNAHLDRCRADTDRYCREMHGVDADLAAHFAVTRTAGIALYGPPTKEMFAPVPREAMLDSILCDVKDADIHADPVYFTLNLCRALAFREENLLLSKESGSRWALIRLPERFYPVILSALRRYAGEDAPVPTDDLSAFRDELLQRILP